MVADYQSSMRCVIKEFYLQGCKFWSSVASGACCVEVVLYSTTKAGEY